ncbi:MAG: glycosyltransferase family 39 protein [Candidatus Omnitrophica bacterium]|nr:glycosyltransferase family 39 protein [Candidatus Omnitrophota bacterium]
MSFRKKIIVILLIGFLFRLFIIFCLPVRTFEASIKRYHFGAINMLEGRGYSHFNSPPYPPSFYKPPVYSIFLAIIYKIFGVNLNAVRIVQALLDTVGCLLLFFILRSYFKERVAFIGLGLAAFCPITAVYTNLLNPESLTVFFMMLSLWLLSKSNRSKNLWLFFAIGISTILMGYCRLEFFSFIFIFGGYLVFTQIKKEKVLKKIAAYSLGVMVVMIPWIVRNYYMTGKFVPLSAGKAVGIHLFSGTLGDTVNDSASLIKYLDENPQIKDIYQKWYEMTLHRRTGLEDQVKYDKILFDMAIDTIRQHPFKYVLMRIKRMPRVWVNLHADEFAFINTKNLRLLHPDFQKIIYYTKNEPKEVLILGTKYLLFAINIFYILLASRGIWLVRRRLLTFSFIFLPLLYAQALYMFIAVDANYTVPYWPCIIFFSAIGLVSSRLID